ncbi:MAG TPA: NADH-quinone oxidoreductase subunit C [Azospirillum sp.]|nr:NADH-quinone oxidoreductase subunit C [Azospirillum sp.]
MSTDLTDRLKAVPGVESVEERTGALWAEGPRLDVTAMAEAMAALGLRLASVTATLLAAQGETTVIYHYVDERSVINVRTRTRNGRLDSLAPTVRAAAWAEREIHDLYAVDFAGHPDPAPLLRPEGFEPGMLREAMCTPATAGKAPASPLARR